MPTTSLTLPRRPWLAALLSAVLPGFGQLYAGRPNRALGLFLAFALLPVPCLILASLFLPISLTAPMVALTTLCAIAVWGFAIVDAWRLARRSHDYLPAIWQTKTVYVTVFTCAAFIALPIVVNYVRTHQVQAFRIASNSMSPTLLRGDMLFADMRYNCPLCAGNVRPGDVALFIYPNDRTRYYIKRVIALPGQTVSIDAGRIAVDGKPVPSFDGIDRPVTMADHVVAPGHVFVLGDNEGKSRDSRDFGDVPLSDVVALPRQIWFSYGEQGIRWDRIGRSVQEARDGR